MVYVLRLAAALLLASLIPGRPLPAQAAPTTPAATLDSARAALAKYRDVLTAVRDGYLSTVACTEFPEPGHAGETPHPAGGMGIHLLNPALIGQPLDPTKPQVLIYEPVGDTLRLIAAEWFVPVQVSAERPSLFGRPFDGPMDGHEPIMPAALRHWDLHVWLWKDNPAGVFSSTNPALKCPPGVNTVRAASSHPGH